MTFFKKLQVYKALGIKSHLYSLNLLAFHFYSNKIIFRIIFLSGKLLENKKILITGAGGFIGRHLITALSNFSAKLYSLDFKEISYPFTGTEYVGKLEDISFLKSSIEDIKPDIVFHLAAKKDRVYSINDFFQSIETNLIGSLNLFSVLNEFASPESIVVLGTAEEYGRGEAPFNENMREAPVSSYSFSKTCLTHLCQVLHDLYALPFVILRPTVAYGPFQNEEMFLPALINSLLRGNEFKMTAGEQTRDFVYVDDLVDAMISATESKRALGEVINVGSASPVTIKELALRVQTIIGKEGLLGFGKQDYRKGEIMNYSVENNKAVDLIDWSPNTSLDDGLKKTIDYYSRTLV